MEAYWWWYSSLEIFASELFTSDYVNIFSNIDGKASQDYAKL